MIKDLYYYIAGVPQIIKFSANKTYNLPIKIVDMIVRERFGTKIIKLKEFSR